jgi:multidrug efflux pump subunit AcrA (membrane-fusion protein)
MNKLEFLTRDSNWTNNRFGKLIFIIFLIVILILFLPWTQSIQSKGKVTAFGTNERPQEIQSVIAGKLNKWYINEGDYVQAGDTIAVITEIKGEYLNPDLLQQTDIQLKAKEKSILSYSSKIDAINNQIRQLEISQDLSYDKLKNKLDQENLKLQGEIADYESAKMNTKISKQQFERDSLLYLQRIKSLFDVENKKNKLQEAISKMLVVESKIRQTKIAIENIKIELQNVSAEYGEKLSKSESDRFSAISGQMEAEGEVSKLRNTYSNYSIRNGFYTITAPQSGFITETKLNGIGETIKEGQSICKIIPNSMNHIVELFIDPVDMPLISVGNHVQFIFDGWPTMVFSGWPKLTYGTFPGEVYAINSVPNENGKYRILVKPKSQIKPWPNELRIGVGANGYLLLKKVPIWYEIWRTMCGFSPDYYKPIIKNEKK